MTTELAQTIARHLPFVRRYARALSGDQRAGDALVASCLQRLLTQPALLQRDSLKLSLYRVLSDLRLESEVAASQTESRSGALENSAIVAQAVARLAGLRRPILLLATLEGFAPLQIAEILRLPEEDVRQELAAGKHELRQQRPTSILIIEDEPIIALDIAHSVGERGHRVTGIATTHREAIDLARSDPPGLVLADIQLSDDSSGVDAVREILEHYRVPVIFITAFPDRLLTGERPEPAFLITKPFEPETLSVAISQALATYRG
jgi:CheY-like chemotaxis protein/DNA-directed RNA polymerase specialized sigma24 family protein